MGIRGLILAAIVMAMSGSTAVAQAIPSPGAGGYAVPNRGDSIRQVSLDGVVRRYLLHIPGSYDPRRATPVILAFHGGGGNPASMIRLSGLNTKSESAGFIVVYPYGSGANPDQNLTFNAGNVGGYAMQKQIDDVRFTRALLDDLEKIANVDKDRIFATGMSNGGMMAYRLASELSDRIAAIASVGGPMGTETCSPVRPVPVLHFHGTEDELAPFRGGYGKGPTGGKGVTDFFSVEHSVRNWIAANGCSPEPVEEKLPDTTADGMRVIRRTWSGGRDGSEVVLVEIEGGGHTWPGMPPLTPVLGKSTLDISANDLMWDFFQRHPKSAVSVPSESISGRSGAHSGMRYLRTPESRFANLPGYDFTPRYVMVDDYEGGKLRMHYVDEGPADGPTILLLHGNPTWSYMFREIVRPLNAAGYRTILLDYIGMGKSDKPMDFDDYTYDRHLGWVRQAFEQLDASLGLGRITLFGHDYGTPFGIRLMAEHYPERFDAFIDANASLPVGDRISPTHLRWRQFVRDNPDVPVGNVVSSSVRPSLSREEIAAYNAPYPDASFKMAIRSFPEMVPDSVSRPEAVANSAAWKYLESFGRPFMTIFGGTDSPDAPGSRVDFISRVPGAFGQPHPQLEVSHYAPEDRPEDVVREVVRFLADVYHPAPFSPVLFSKFERPEIGPSILSGEYRFDPERRGLRLVGGASDSGYLLQKDTMNLRSSDALKIAFRFQSFGMKDGEGIAVELWDGSRWMSVLTLRAGSDFRNGVDDYGFVRIEDGPVRFSSEARVRIRCTSTRSSAGLYLYDLGMYARKRGDRT